MDQLAGKVAVITGAGSGLGRALAHRLGSAGMRLVLADIDSSRLNDVGGELDDKGAKVATLVTDVSKRSQVEGLADLAYEQFGAVNVLCNNAGVAVVGSAWECTDADWAWAMGVNLWGVIHGLQAFVPRMLKAGEPGHIVNTASAAGILAPPLSSPYVATKHAVVGMTESLFHDLALRESKIGCSVLAPGFVKTQIATSEAFRPEELKNPVPSSDPLMAEVGKYYAHEVARGIPAEAVADAVHEAIVEGRFYIFTHPEMTPAFEDRFSRMVAGKNPKTRPLAASRDDDPTS
ncbi:MAG: SDR family NAD(P)-dependent oxidoreductase [Nannocystales bacterium]